MDISIEAITKRDPRILARAISLIENQAPEAQRFLPTLYKKSGKAHIIGVTGSPGAGKSTLVDELAAAFRKSGKSVAILAVDPSSPFSGGAILGDRIRMNKISEDGSMFLRSMATRGALGGVGRATLDAAVVLDSAGFDIILVETVGVGQAEIDIVRLADTCLVVLVPGMGDSVQAFKAGILEIADIFVINKSDRDGADILHRDLRSLISLGNYQASDWKPSIISTIATKGDGVPELLEDIEKHVSWSKSGNDGKIRKTRIITDMIIKLCGDTIARNITEKHSKELHELASACFDRKEDPYSAAKKILSKL